MKRTIALAALAATMMVGCVTAPTMVRIDPSYEQAAKDQFLATNRAALDALVSGFNREAYGDAPILVATIVDINDLRRSVPLGRSLSEQYASRLVGRGFNVKELKLRGHVFVQEGTGELLLSREIKDIARSHSAMLVLVGTYSLASTVTYINLKLVRTEDGRIVHAHDYALPNDRDILRLLQASR
jgi:TolB-like protein